MKRRRFDPSLLEAGHLILHQSNEGRNDQGQARQDGRRQLITERFSLTGRHNRHGVTPGQYGANDLFLARPKGRKAEPFTELFG